MKKILLVVALLSVTLFARISPAEGIVFAESETGGVSIATFRSGVIGISFPFMVEKSIMIVIGDDGELIEFTLQGGDKMSNGGYLYDVLEDNALIRMMKYNNSITVVILSSRYGDSDGLWGQDINCSGYTAAVNRMWR